MVPENSERNSGPDNLARVASDFTDSSHYGQLSDRNVHLIDHASNILATTLHIDLAFERFATEARNLVHFDRLTIHLVDLDDRSVVIKYVAGEASAGVRAGNRQPPDNTEAQDVMLTGRDLVRSDMVIGPRFRRDKSYLELGMRSSIVVGLRTPLHFVGTIALASRTLESYGSREKAIVNHLASSIAPRIASVGLYESRPWLGRENAPEVATAKVGCRPCCGISHSGLGPAARGLGNRAGHRVHTGPDL